MTTCHSPLLLSNEGAKSILTVLLSAAISACVSGPPPAPSSKVLSYAPSIDDEYLKSAREILLDGASIGIQGASDQKHREDPSEPAMAKLGKRNALLTNYAVREESPFYRCSYRSDYPCDKPPATKISALSGEPVLPPVTPWPAGLPRMCIAFSGGGSRSAAFSIGVMQALAISNQLDRIDVASGVSGGSYALSWLLVTKVNEQEMAEQAIDSTTLLADDAPPIQSLAPRSTLISLPYGIIAVPATLLDKAIKTVLGSEGSASNSYWAALDATFLAGDCEKCLIDGRFLVRDLAPLVLRDQLPFPIIGLSARTEEQGVCDQPGVKRKSLEETFFEVTPLRQGVMNHYSDTGLDLGLADAVALSGAAISVPAASYCEITRVLGLGLGTWKSYTSASHIPAESSSKTNSSDWQSSLEETRLFLADGGHVENLGAFPLIQRLCQSIIVVDAEEDPELEFEALTKLTAFLAARSLKWSVPPTIRKVNPQMISMLRGIM